MEEFSTPVKDKRGESKEVMITSTGGSEYLCNQLLTPLGGDENQKEKTKRLNGNAVRKKRTIKANRKRKTSEEDKAALTAEEQAVRREENLRAKEKRLSLLEEDQAKLRESKTDEPLHGRTDSFPLQYGLRSGSNSFPGRHRSMGSLERCC